MGVIWTSRALKQLKKLRDPKAQRRIVLATRKLDRFPNVGGIKALRGHRYGFRLRVGDYRVLFDVFESIRIISIEEVKRRNERTY